MAQLQLDSAPAWAKLVQLNPPGANYAPGVHDTGAETTNLLEIACTPAPHTLPHLCKQIN